MSLLSLFGEVETPEMDLDGWPEHVIQRHKWDQAHPRCDGCGQFLGGGETHYVQDYFGEWDHA